MLPATSEFTPIYPSFQQAQLQIAEILPIDYFTAKSLLDEFSPLFRNENDQKLLFHTLMALAVSLRDGHNCLPLKDVADSRFGYSADKEGIVEHHGYVFPSLTVINELCLRLGIDDSGEKLVVLSRGYLYFRRYFVFERELERDIKNRQLSLDKNLQFERSDIKHCINTLFPVDNATEIDWQKVAVANAINKPFCVIAGGPGTGKTYTVTKLLAALVMLQQSAQQQGKNSSDLRMGLVAPTGKAAQRLSESIVNAVSGFRETIDDNVLDKIPSNAQTLHRLLGVIPNSPNFRHNETNQLALDVLLIDEVSMVDVAMMARVMRALPDNCRIILLGDADQLPSVAAGSVLADLAPRPHQGYSQNNRDYLQEVSSEKLPSKLLAKKAKPACDHVTFLTHSRRFDGEGGIGKIARFVIGGDANESWQLLKGNQQAFSQNQQALTLASTQLSLWLPQLVKHYYQPLADCQDIKLALALLAKFRVLCATRQGETGVESINDYITQLLGKHSHNNQHYHGQPIMISENDYRLSLYNGDIGMIWRNDAGHLMAVFEEGDGQLKWIMPSRLPQYETVYAMTIHKTQGSEFNHVAMVLPEQKDNRLLSRELLYTGITRAKEQLTIACHENVWLQGVETAVYRHSGFSISSI